MTYPNLGAFIKERRLAKGLKQAELAERLGTTESQVIRWEGGQNQPQRYAESLAQELAFDVALLGLLAGLDENLTKAEEVLAAIPRLEAQVRDVVAATQQPQDQTAQQQGP